MKTANYDINTIISINVIIIETSSRKSKQFNRLLMFEDQEFEFVA